MAAFANPQLAALMQAMQARGGAPNPQAQMAAAMPPGPLPSINAPTGQDPRAAAMTQLVANLGLPTTLPPGITSTVPGVQAPVQAQAGGTGLGPLPGVLAPGGTGMGGLPPGWQAALNNIGQAGPPNAQAAMTAAMPQLGPGANAMMPQGTLSPQAIQAAGGILAGRRPRLSR
jgi:hypothetical protein